MQIEYDDLRDPDYRESRAVVSMTGYTDTHVVETGRCIHHLLDEGFNVYFNGEHVTLADALEMEEF